MRSPLRVVVFASIALVAAYPALAQQSIVYSVAGWGKLSTRDDGKGVANSFQWGVGSIGTSATGAGAGQGKLVIQDATLSIALGDAAILFTQAAMRGHHLPSILVEFPLTRGASNAPAPFAFRLTEVQVNGVRLGKTGQDGGPGTAEIYLGAQKIELYSGNVDPKSGKFSPGAKAGFDATTGRAF